MYFRSELGVSLPPGGCYATGNIFMDEETHEECEKKFTEIAQRHNMEVIKKLKIHKKLLNFT